MDYLCEINNFVVKLIFQMLKFISFGSGSSGNCYYILTEKGGMMIDVGVGMRTLRKYFCEYGLPVTDLHNILITHDHADHIKSVGTISRKFEIPVHATSRVHAGIEDNYSVRCKVDKERKVVIESGKPFVLDGMRITPFHVPHDSNDNVGYRIDYEGVVFCIMTDVGHVTDEMKTMIQEANYLVIEANFDDEMLEVGPYPRYLKDRIKSGTGHLSNAKCAQALIENFSKNLRHVWLCHLSEENNHPELARKSIIQLLHENGIEVGKDVQLDVLKRRVPDGFYELA